MPHPAAAQGHPSISLDQTHPNGGMRWTDPQCSQHRPWGQGKGTTTMSPPHCHPGREGVRLCMRPCHHPHHLQRLLVAPSSLSRSISIATNQPRKLCVTSWPSPAVPEDGTSQSPCWGRRCPLQVPWVPQMPLGALGAEGRVAAPTPTVVPTKGDRRGEGN